MRLAPWERPQQLYDMAQGGSDLTATIAWEGGRREFMFRWVAVSFERSLLFARPTHSTDEGNWVVCDPRGVPFEVENNSWRPNRRAGYVIPDSDAGHISEPGAILDAVAKSLAEDNSPLQLARFMVVQMGLQDEQYAILRASGTGLWIGLYPLDILADFPFELISNFSSDGHSVHKWFSNQLALPKSEINFSRRWSTLTPDKRLAILCGHREKVLELQQVMRWTLESQNQLWQIATAWKWHVGTGTNFGSLAPNYLRDSSPNPNDFAGYSNLQRELPFVYQVARFLVESYLPRLVAPVRQRHPSTTSFPAPDSIGNIQWTLLDVHPAPTAHEQLEASLNLRDWLQEHASPDEFTAIYGTA